MNALADDVFQKPHRTLGLLPELRRRLGVDALMGVPMRSHFMTAGVNRPHQLRMALGNPAKDKKCGSSLVCLQEVKKTEGIMLNPTLIDVPFGTLDDRFKTGDVIVILDVNRQGIQHGTPLRHGLRMVVYTAIVG